MMLPRCKNCLGRGWYYQKGDPTRHTCADCQGTGRRPAAQVTKDSRIDPIGPRKRVKMAQVREFKAKYVDEFNDPAAPKLVDGAVAAPCQTCRDLVGINRSEFSHKVAAGMGGAGDVGGNVSDKNGTYSCSCCHAFIEQDREAFEQHRDSPANISNALPVIFTTPVLWRLNAFRKKWYNNPNLKDVR